MRSLIHWLLALSVLFFSATVFAQAIDINTATVEQMEKALKGIGPKKAADIVKYREANGPFKSVDDLTKVPGVKGKTLSQIRPLITVGAMPVTPAAPATSSTAESTMPSIPAAPAVPITPIPPSKTLPKP